MTGIKRLSILFKMPLPIPMSALNDVALRSQSPGESKLNSYFKMLEHILVTPVQNRPWKIRSSTTTSVNDFCTDINNNREIFPDTYCGIKLM
jgi:hypothetical protein